MIDINNFLIMLVCILSSILLVILIILGVKLIDTTSKFNRLLDDVQSKLAKADKIINVTDAFANSITLVGDKVFGSIVDIIKKVFGKRKGENDYE